LDVKKLLYSREKQKSPHAVPKNKNFFALKPKFFSVSNIIQLTALHFYKWQFESARNAAVNKGF